jgi:hypothetical protein
METKTSHDRHHILKSRYNTTYCQLSMLSVDAIQQVLCEALVSRAPESSEKSSNFKGVFFALGKSASVSNNLHVALEKFVCAMYTTKFYIH